MNDSPLTYIEKTPAETKPVGFWRVYGLGVIALWVVLAARSFTRSYGTWAGVYSIVFAAIIATGWVAALVAVSACIPSPMSFSNINTVASVGTSAKCVCRSPYRTSEVFRYDTFPACLSPVLLLDSAPNHTLDSMGASVPQIISEGLARRSGSACECRCWSTDRIRVASHSMS